MMMKEFTDRTGFEPTCDEYDEIEEAYYQFDGNKDEFCRRFIAEGGIQKVYEARAEKIALLKSKLVESDKLLRQTMDDYEKRISHLEAELEREQEWQPYEDEHNVKQADYEKLAKEVAHGAHYMTDEEAIDWVVQETGFARERIQIVHELPLEEINRHRQVRRTGKMVDRRPIYDATDYHYIVFNVRANETHGWELHNDELTPYWS